MPSDNDKQSKEKASGEGKPKEGKDEAADTPKSPTFPGGESKSSRAERKRNREQKRRNEVNQGLEELTKLIFAIDPQLKAEAEERARKTQGAARAGAVNESQLLSRVELVNGAVATLSRVHKENEMNKLIIDQLMRGGLAGSAGSTLATRQMTAAAAAASNATLPFSTLRSADAIMGLAAGLPRGLNPMVNQALVEAAAAASPQRGIPPTAGETAAASTESAAKESATTAKETTTTTPKETEEDGPPTKRLKKRQKNESG